MIELRIFVSSPNDVGNERGVCGTVVSRLQLEFRGLVRLQAIFWENELLRPDQTFQSQIPRASNADACIFILWSWFGTPLPAAVASRADGTTYLSGTECEFEDAMASRRARGTPNIFVYRKVADVPVSVRSRDVELMQRSQRDALDGFLDKWFRGEGGTFKVAFYESEHPAGFERLLETHLRRWIIEELEKAGVAEAAVHREAQWKGARTGRSGMSGIRAATLWLKLSLSTKPANRPRRMILVCPESASSSTRASDCGSAFATMREEGRSASGSAAMRLWKSTTRMQTGARRTRTTGAPFGSYTSGQRMGPSSAACVMLEAGDVIVSYDGKPVADVTEFIDWVARPGPSVRLLVIARGGHQIWISVPPGRLGIQIHQRYLPPSQLGSP